MPCEGFAAAQAVGMLIRMHCDPAAAMDDEPQLIHVPEKGNEKLKRFMELVNANDELLQVWRCANVNAVDRAGMSDHGWTHVQIVANGAYKIFRLLLEAGVTPSLVANYKLSTDDAGVVVVAGSLLHDLGMSIQREDHEIYSVLLAKDILRPLLGDMYDLKARVIMTSDILHCIVAHQTDEVCLTVEAGVVKVADALDMSEGRSRIPFEMGKLDIHSVSALAIDRVDLSKGKEKPVRIDIRMNNYAGIFQVDELLKPKIITSSIAQYIEVCALVSGEQGQQLGVVYSM
jgi:uncharacterized protein